MNIYVPIQSQPRYGKTQAGKDWLEYMTEQQLQASCVQWFHNEPKLIHLRRMLHCNNNNSVNRIAGNVAKAVGVVAGVSDLELILPDMVVFIELKTIAGKQSPEQIDFMNKVVAMHHHYFIIRTLEEFKELVWKLINLSK